MRSPQASVRCNPSPESINKTFASSRNQVCIEDSVSNKIKIMHLHSSKWPWGGSALGPSARPLDAAQATHVALWVRIGAQCNKHFNIYWPWICSRRMHVFTKHVFSKHVFSKHREIMFREIMFRENMFRENHRCYLRFYPLLLWLVEPRVEVKVKAFTSLLRRFYVCSSRGIARWWGDGVERPQGVS